MCVCDICDYGEAAKMPVEISWLESFSDYVILVHGDCPSYKSQSESIVNLQAIVTIRNPETQLP